jgi:hypothetical protein
VKVNYDIEHMPPPTHRLEVVNLLMNKYRIRKAGAIGEHHRVWNTFYEEFRNVASRPNWARYEIITAETDPEMRLVEMHQRHLVNYVPGRGYIELRSPGDAEELRDKLAADVIADQATAFEDDYLQLEMLAAIDSQNGVYHLHHGRLTTRRRNWLNQFECPANLSTHIEGVLT